MSVLVSDELVRLLKENTSDPEDVLKQMVLECGLVDYLDSVVSEAAGGEDSSIAVDIDGLKEVVDGFLPPVAELSRDTFSAWFDLLLAKRLSAMKADEILKSSRQPQREEDFVSFTQFKAKKDSGHRQRSSHLVQENSSVEEDSEELMKKQLIEKFSYVAEDEYQRTHRPHVNINEEKKLTRFKDNKIVSTKGDRYAVEKKPESEEMKATYVHIKQLRRFKFH